MMIKRLFIACIFPISTIALGQSQVSELVGSGGDSFVSDNYQLDWSLGELMVETYQSETNRLTQGFHQENHVSPVTGLGDVPKELVPAIIFPNPTRSNISITVPDELFSRGSLTYSLINLEGQESISAGAISSQTMTLDLSRQAIGLYLLTIYRNSERIKSFKVFKNN